VPASRRDFVGSLEYAQKQPMTTNRFENHAGGKPRAFCFQSDASYVGFLFTCDTMGFINE
jgi:hypothetical protein